MKKIFILALVCINSVIFAQKKNQRGITKIEQSVLSLSENIPTFVHYNDQIIFKLKDVNTFLYNINFKEIQRDNISKEIVPKDDFQILYNASDYSLEEVSYTDFNLPASTNSPGTSSLKNFNLEIKKAEEVLSDRSDYLDELILKKDELNNDTSKLNQNQLIEIVKLKKKLDEKIELAEKQFKEAKVILADINFKKEEQLASSIDINEHIEAFRYGIDQYLQVVSSINTKVNFYTELLFLMYSNQTFMDIEKSKMKLLRTYLGADVRSEDIMGHCNMLFDDLDLIYISLNQRYTEMPKRDKIEESFQKLVKYHNGIDRKKYRLLFNQIVKTYLAINESNWTVDYQTSMISDKADKIAYSISLTPIASQYTTSNKAIQLNYDFDINGGVKIDISAGIFYHLNLNDDQYRFERLTDSSSSIIKENDNRQYRPSIGALFNVYRRSSNSIKFAFNFGAGTNVDKIFYYSGASILFGKSERVGISGGIVGGTVARISSELENKSVINIPLDQLTEVPMQRRDPFKIGYFIGISYNLSGKNQSAGPAMKSN